MEEALTIIKELGIGAGGVAFVSRLFGPALSEAGGLISDSVRQFRLKKTVGYFADTQETLRKAGINPRNVSLKVLLPLIDGASIEDDGNLYSKWVALLANAASSDSQIEVQAGFADILKQVTPLQAQILDVVFEGTYVQPTEPTPYLRQGVKLTTIMDKIPTFQISSMEVEFDNLRRLQLVSKLYSSRYLDSQNGGYYNHATLTDSQISRICIEMSALGTAFMKACSIPKK